MSHFYLTLPSNSSSSYYSNNTMTNYTTKLHNRTCLTGEWEVGLSEISFPKTWYTIEKATPNAPRTGGRFTLSCKGHPNFADYSYDLYVPTGYYESMTDIVRAINDAMENYRFVRLKLLAGITS